MSRAATTRLLTRHFLRRFFDNDLIAPHIDLHENVTMICAALVSTTLFLSVMFAAKILIGVPTPGTAAMIALGDTFFFLSASMIAMALLAAVQWDAVSLDARDTANLGPLPIARSVIVRAKLIALATFAGGFIAALNLAPTLVYWFLFVAKVPVGVTGMLRMILTHAIVSTLASAFAFLAVVALRELLRAVLGGAWFARVSGAVQALLILVLISAMLLLPGVQLTVFPSALPSSWFLSLSETLRGGIIANVTGMRVPLRLAWPNAHWLGVYRSHEQVFGELAALALIALAVVTVIAVAAYAWNVRRLPQPVASSSRRRRPLRLLTALFAGRHPIARAGFAFALQALTRSPAHRLSMATAAALATALSFVVLGRIDLGGTFDPSAPPYSLLAFQTMVLLLLLGGFRHAVRRPAELKANWIMQLAWRGGDRHFLSGVKRAAIVGVGLFTLAVLWPFHAWLIGAQTASLHLLAGLLLSITAVEAFFSRYRNVPFASDYEPASNLKALGPIGGVGFLLFVYGFTRIERLALQSTDNFLTFAGTLAGIGIALNLFDRWMRRGAGAQTFGAPEAKTQWLGLSS